MIMYFFSLWNGYLFQISFHSLVIISKQFCLHECLIKISDLVSGKVLLPLLMGIFYEFLWRHSIPFESSFELQVCVTFDIE